MLHDNRSRRTEVEENPTSQHNFSSDQAGGIITAIDDLADSIREDEASDFADAIGDNELTMRLARIDKDAGRFFHRALGIQFIDVGT